MIIAGENGTYCTVYVIVLKEEDHGEQLPAGQRLLGFLTELKVDQEYYGHAALAFFYQAKNNSQTSSEILKQVKQVLLACSPLGIPFNTATLICGRTNEFLRVDRLMKGSRLSLIFKWDVAKAHSQDNY